MLTTLKKVLDKANRGRYAVPAFNINNLEIAQAVSDAAGEMRSPVILQTSEGAIEYAGMEALAAIARTCAKLTKVPVVFHLDHGKNEALVERAVKSGLYTSVMIDASAKPYKENVRISKKIVRMAHERGVSVEAELGAIAGIEDFVSVEARDAHLTDPEQAARFVRETGCDALAVAIGTAHGAFKFKGETILDIARLKKIKKLTRRPLVLHGASGVNPEWVARLREKCDRVGDCDRLEGAKGVSDTMQREAVKGGINKVNVDTDLRIAFTAGVRQGLLSDSKVFDPRKIMAPAKDLMREVAKHKMALLNSKNKG
jgi:fructose-bisphosphate aldolase class II